MSEDDRCETQVESTADNKQKERYPGDDAGNDQRQQNEALEAALPGNV